MTAEIQNSQGQWVPYAPGGANDNGRSNIRIDGTVYSYYGGQAAYNQQLQAANVPAANPTPTGPDPGPIPTDPTVTDPNASNQVGSGTPWEGDAPTSAPPGFHWDPTYAMFLADDNPVSPGPAAPAPATGGGGGSTPPSYTPAPAPAPGWSAPQGPPSSGYGAAPPVYQSNPNAPVYTPGPAAPVFTPLPEYKAPTWTGGDFVNPTLEEVQGSPGYQSRLDALIKGRERQSAAQGTILSGGTLKALDRAGQDYATGEYQSYRANALENYKQRYGQFTDAAGMDLNARTLNANANQATFGNALSTWTGNANQNQNTFNNQTQTYNTGNARTLSDYLTNVTAQRNAELDYWNRLNDLNTTGATLAGGSYRA